MKPYQDITDPRLAKALAHPLRTRLLGALEGRTASPSELAAELGAPLGVVSYHARRLTALGFVKLVRRVPRHGAVERYTATSRPRITDEAWASTPSIVKQATIKAALEQVGSYVNAAATAGGFDNSEAHLTRSPVMVAEQGFRAIARELESLTGRIQKLEADSTRRLKRADHEGQQHATIVLMLFHSPAEVPANNGRSARSSSRGHKEPV